MVRSRKISVDVATCMGCHTCELACAAAHSQAKDLIKAFAAGESLTYRIFVESFRDTPVPVPCNHCEEAACVAACPTGAARRESDGAPVLIDQDRCIGCGMCTQACPFGVVAVDSATRRAYKCDLCIERLAKGEDPACVAACPTASLAIGDGGAFNKGKREKVAAMLAEAAADGRRELPAE